MDPIIGAGIMAGAQAASGIMQYYQSEKARKATGRRLKEIEAMFDALVPPDFNISVWDDPKLVGQIPPPAFNMEGITPELYKSVGQFIPQVAHYVEEANPELVQETATAHEGQKAQLDALRRYREIAAGGRDPELDQQLSEASRRERADAQSARDSSLQDAQRRGTFGSGMEMATQQNAMAEGMQRQAMQSQAAAVAAYKNRLNAMDRGASLGGDIRQGEMADQARNVGIINDFNERTSARRQAWENQRSNTVNDGRARNLDQAQRLSNANVDIGNRGREQNQERGDRLMQTDYQNRLGAQDRLKEDEERKNRLKQQMHENLRAKMQGRAGLAGQQINYLQQDARDRNATTQGVTDAISSGALYYGKSEMDQRKMDLEERKMALAERSGIRDRSTTPGNYRYEETDDWRTA